MAQFNTSNNAYLNSNKTLFEVIQIADQYGNLVGAANPSGMAVDAFGRARVSQPYTIFDSFNRYVISNDFVTSNTSNTEIQFDSNSSATSLIVDTQSGSKVQRETKKIFVYQPGKSLHVLNSFVFNTPKENLSQRVGYYNDLNGVYFENDGADNKLVIKSTSSGTTSNNAITQDNWNIDKLDGSGPSKLTLDVSKSQIFFTDIEWLGVGSVRCGFVINGTPILCHVFHHANIITSSYMTTACLPIRYEIENTGVTSSSSTLKQICSSVISEGGYELEGDQRTFGLEPNTQRALATAGTYYPVISIRLHPDRIDEVVVIKDVAALAISSANYRLKIVRDATIEGAVWANVGISSCVQYNSNNSSTMTGGTDIFSDYFSSTNQGAGSINLSSDVFKYQLERNGLTGTPLTMTLSIAAGTNSSNVVASFSWEEIT